MGSGSNWGQSMLYTKSLQVLNRKGISMLTALKMSSLTCKCVFYRPELNAKAGPHRIEFSKPWNETYQWIELKEYTKKNGVICLVVMFTSIVMVFKMAEIAIFLYFLLITAKSLSQFGEYI